MDEEVKGTKDNKKDLLLESAADRAKKAKDFLILIMQSADLIKFTSSRCGTFFRIQQKIY